MKNSVNLSPAKAAVALVGCFLLVSFVYLLLANPVPLEGDYLAKGIASKAPLTLKQVRVLNSNDSMKMGDLTAPFVLKLRYVSPLSATGYTIANFSLLSGDEKIVLANFSCTFRHVPNEEPASVTCPVPIINAVIEPFSYRAYPSEPQALTVYLFNSSGAPDGLIASKTLAVDLLEHSDSIRPYYVGIYGYTGEVNFVRLKKGECALGYSSSGITTWPDGRRPDCERSTTLTEIYPTTRGSSVELSEPNLFVRVNSVNSSVLFHTTWSLTLSKTYYAPLR